MNGQVFFVLKGLIGVVAVLTILYNMNNSWAEFDRDPITGESVGVAQRLRYITLFYFAVLITAVSTQQATDGNQPIDWRAIGAFVGVSLCLLTAIVSVREAREKRLNH